MSLKKNIKKYRLECKMTLDEVSEKIGVKKSTLQRYESGVISNVPSDKIEKMAEIFGIKPSTLMGWDSPNENNSSSKEKQTPIYSITVYGKVCAGNGIEALENPIDEIGDPYYRIKREKFALEVHGDSMDNIIPNGMYAIIEKTPIVKNGEIAVVMIDKEVAMLKRFYQLDDMVILRPDSSNPHHKPLMFAGEEINSLKILGRYLGYVTPMENLL